MSTSTDFDQKAPNRQLADLDLHYLPQHNLSLEVSSVFYKKFTKQSSFETILYKRYFISLTKELQIKIHLTNSFSTNFEHHHLKAP